MYNAKYIKTKIKIYNDRINANFLGKKMPEYKEFCTCLFVILLDSVVKIGIDYYPQIFLEECKYVIKKKNIINLLTKSWSLMNPMMSLIMISLMNLIKIKIVFEFYGFNNVWLKHRIHKIHDIMYSYTFMITYSSINQRIYF